MKRPKTLRLFGGLVAAALVGLTLWIGGISSVWSLLTGVKAPELGVALAAAAGIVVTRGFRLSLLLPAGALRLSPAIPVAAVAQAAALFIPARLGELALPYLLRRDSGMDGASGIATLLAARVLDTATLGVWAAAAVLVRFGLESPAALFAALALFLPLALVPLGAAWLDDFVGKRRQSWGGRGARWADRLHRVRCGLDSARRRPWRLAGAFLACLLTWTFQWILVWWLLAAMGFRWPVADVVSGSIVASLANFIPVNLVANLGTLEAGWTAAFAALGISLDVAAATGLATHLWSLFFAALFGGLAWFFLRQKGGKTCGLGPA